MFSSSRHAKGARIWRCRRFSSAGPGIPALAARWQRAAGSQALAALLAARDARERTVQVLTFQTSALPAAEAARWARSLEPAERSPTLIPPAAADVAFAQPPAPCRNPRR